MHILLLLLRTSRWDALAGIAAGAVAGLATSGFAWTLQQVVTSGGQNLPVNAAIFAACWLAYGAGAVLADNRLTRVAQRAVRELRLSLSRRILDTPLPVLEREQQRIFPVLIEDIATISNAAANLPSALSGLVTVLGCMGLMAFISWKLSLACAVLMIVAFAGHLIPLRRFERHLERWRTDWDGISRLIDAIVRGHKELLIDPRKRQAFFSRHLDPLCRRQETELTRASTWETLLKRWGELLLLLGVGLLLFTLPLHGWATYEQFGRFLFVSLFILAPLATIVGFGAHLSRVKLALARAARVTTLLDAPDTPLQADAPAPTAPAGTDIRLGLHAATYRHSRDDEAPFDLGPVTLHFDRPEIVFICGGNGSGKTTLLKLLCGLYPPHGGDLLAGGRIVRTPAEIAAHRARCAVVFADFYLFDGLLGYENIPPEKAAALLREVRLDHQVALGSEGAFSSTRLSQGQRKRLALVAALLEDKPIYIFDEWAADQDPEFRRLFYEHILPGLRDRGKLVLAISHDEAYYPLADRHLHLVDGRIIRDTRPAST